MSTHQTNLKYERQFAGVHYVYKAKGWKNHKSRIVPSEDKREDVQESNGHKKRLHTKNLSVNGKTDWEVKIALKN